MPEPPTWLRMVADMTDISQMRLGKRPVRHDHRTLQVRKYLPADLPPAPESLDWGVKTDGVWPMYDNDQIGDCTCCAAAHLLQTWTAAGQSREVEVDVADVLDLYARQGYIPGDPTTDNGAVELDVLNSWRRGGLAGHKIGAFAAVNRADLALVRQAANAFVGLYIGIELPISAQGQQVWSCTNGPDSMPGSWGGHAVGVVGYDIDGLTVITWGEPKRMTWEFWRCYVSEAYAIVSDDYLTGLRAPCGLDIDQLVRDLAEVTR